MSNETLHRYLQALTHAEKNDYASRSGTSLGYLQKICSTGGQIGVGLSIVLDRESGGKVEHKKLRPDVDWSYVEAGRSAGMVLEYQIENPGEMSAGLYPYSETVTIAVGSDAGGEPGEFAEFMRLCLEEWFDGSAVEIVNGN